MYKILICATVPETLATNLRGQPAYLKRFFDIALVTSPHPVFRRRIDAEGVPIHEVPMSRRISIFADIRSVFSMVRLLRSLRPMVVHSYTPKAGLVSMFSAWICRVPVRIHTFTGLIFPTATGFRKHLLIWIDRLICACATHVIPEGNGVKNDLSAYRITRKSMGVIGYGNIAGVDTSYFDPTVPSVRQQAAETRRRLNIGSDAFVFCFVGRLHRDKGIAELLTAFERIAVNAHLLLVGGFDDNGVLNAKDLHAISKNPRIHALGFVDDIRPALSASDLLVLPSYREGFPNSVLQAGAMGLPVIATDINGCNEIISHDYNGWLIPPRNSEALRQAMELAYSLSAVQREEMGRRGRERILERFEQVTHWGRMVSFYKSVSVTGKGQV